MSKSKKRKVFTLILVLFPFLIIISAELLLRIFNYDPDPLMFVEDDNNKLYLKQNTLAAKAYFPQLENPPKSGYDAFLRNKKAGTFRVFVLGASTAAGFPYHHGVVFSRQLKEMLEQRYSDFNIEVINTAMAAINSHTLLHFAEEVIKQDPDLVLIYAGHNEYYGMFGAGSSVGYNNPKLYFTLRKSRLVRLVSNIINKWKKIVTPDGQTMMALAVAEQDIPYDGEIYQKGLIQFEENLSLILSKFQKSSTPVIISKLVSNQKDHLPFDFLSKYPKEEHKVVLTAIEEQDTVILNQLRLNFKDKGEVAIDNFINAKIHEISKRYEFAKNDYLKAIEYDKIRFRAPAAINNIIENIAERYNVKVADTYQSFVSLSENGIIGHELITEHLHPNEKGYQLIAKTFAEEIHNQFFSNTISNEDWYGIYQNEKPYTQVEVAMGKLYLMRIMNNWPFVSFEESISEDPVIGIEGSNLEEKLAKAIYLEKMSWPEAMDRYYTDQLKKANYNELVSIAKALLQEYPYMVNLQEKLADAYLLTNNIAESNKRFKELYKNQRNPKYLIPIFDYYVAIDEYVKAKELVELIAKSDYNFRTTLKALNDILAVDDVNFAHEDAAIYLNAAGAYIYLDKLEKAEEMLVKAKLKNANFDQLNSLKSIIDERKLVQN